MFFFFNAELTTAICYSQKEKESENEVKGDQNDDLKQQSKSEITLVSHFCFVF